ncbi:alpha/beta hydrolase [Algiphilus sp. W345]|uniref:Alpha/beta hydrolase n=1 Tax=Banduia mediterranea TaxID=3075609 RepID=A0ABU2WEV9_9GAMM|nr:alpha/beta hydrolase [Algiphilus sp. W345]MDT0496397.1 alpha/beta hydrolase [Algiphilus sp. W345]
MRTLLQTRMNAIVNLLLALDRLLAGVKLKRLRSGGLEWVYLDSGGNGEPLVLVHGFGGDKTNWTLICRRLRGRYRIIVPDLPGFGESESPVNARYRVQDHVERLRGFLHDLGIERPHLGGNSMGGYTVALYAAQHPAEVASLWLIDAAGVFGAKPSELLAAVQSNGPNPLLPQTPAQFREVLSFAMSKPPYIPGFVLDVMCRRAMACIALRDQQFKDILEHSPHLEPLLPAVPAPTHILWGDRDRLIDVDCVRVFGELLPNSSSTVLPGIGHMPMLEAPAESARDYLAFRERLAVQEAIAAVPAV